MSIRADLRVEVPRAFLPLLVPKRHKGAYGGRGGAKSHFFAEQLVLRCYSETTRAVCIREIQNTLKESVRQLLIDKIAKFGLQADFEVTETEIRCLRNDSLIIFKGMQSYNAESIKSLEGFDIAWVEEGQTLSARSLRLLRPTIRKPGSEIWYSWNPRHDDDPVDVFFRGPSPPPDALAVRVNASDNPWFPDVLARERDHDYATDPEMADHVWGGGYEIVTEGAYFAKLLHQAEQQGRIGHFPYDPRYRLVTAWDIGVDDYTAIWFIQDNGLIAWVVDYYEASGEQVPEIVENCMPELMPDVENLENRLRELERPIQFRYERHFLPHDVKVREWGGGQRNRILTLFAHGVKPVEVGVPDKDSDHIAATRRLLPVVRFHNSRRVALGIARLRRYSRKWNESMKTFGKPLHDMNSHGAQAFGEYAFNCGLVLPDDPAAQPSGPDLTKPMGGMTIGEFVEAEEAPRREERA